MIARYSLLLLSLLLRRLQYYLGLSGIYRASRSMIAVLLHALLWPFIDVIPSVCGPEPTCHILIRHFGSWLQSARPMSMASN